MNSKSEIKVGDRIRQLRKQEGLTIADLAYKSSLTPNHLGMIERSQKNPTIGIIEKIADGLGVSLFELFAYDNVTGVSKINAKDPYTVKILAQLEDTTMEQKKTILKIIKLVKSYDTK